MPSLIISAVVSQIYLIELITDKLECSFCCVPWKDIVEILLHHNVISMLFKFIPVKIVQHSNRKRAVKELYTR